MRLFATIVAASVLATSGCSKTTPEVNVSEVNLTNAAADRDRLALTNVVQTIARGADEHQWALVRAAFAPTVRLDYGEPESLSSDDIIARWQPLLESFNATQHALRDIVVTVSNDSASVTSQFDATHLLDGSVWTLSGRYEHEATRTPSGWVVTAMRMIPVTSSGDTTLLERAKNIASLQRP